MIAIDTNILIYVFDARDPVKQQKAKTLVSGLVDGVLLWQVAVEYVSASRKLVAQGFGPAQAMLEIDRFRQSWTTLLPTWDVFDRAGGLRQRFALSLWDSLVVAACLEASVTHLYSEDFDAYKTIDGLQLVNPFKP
ncbi:MAG TPA: PIN domain-containing protein [Blastocatellia bacterium]|nr:PIN domain-containing protein [Blastocatellia bacterium]HMV82771.1 PIN domain-containing protein [Blastocatellia bacterium]HMX29000.1 PIN domain-containing protein [Blastocatellia bacterium]HMY74004.1 PIN domain-containing protein [Blastocatellia bacterium]HMZ19746.1 PIN domain-containing protein [Blastocatellia bacterium]